MLCDQKTKLALEEFTCREFRNISARAIKHSIKTKYETMYTTFLDGMGSPRYGAEIEVGNEITVGNRVGIKRAIENFRKFNETEYDACMKKVEIDIERIKKNNEENIKKETLDDLNFVHMRKYFRDNPTFKNFLKEHNEQYMLAVRTGNKNKTNKVKEFLLEFHTHIYDKPIFEDENYKGYEMRNMSDNDIKRSIQNGGMNLVFNIHAYGPKKESAFSMLYIDEKATMEDFNEIREGIKKYLRKKFRHTDPKELLMDSIFNNVKAPRDGKFDICIGTFNYQTKAITITEDFQGKYFEQMELCYKERKTGNLCI